MKAKQFIFFAAIIIIMSCNSTEGSKETPKNIFKEEGNVEAAPLSAPFTRGVNFTGWFEASSAQSILFTKYNERDFADECFEFFMDLYNRETEYVFKKALFCGIALIKRLGVI